MDVAIVARIGQFELIDENLAIDYEKSIKDNAIIPFSHYLNIKKWSKISHLRIQ